ncbi:MAG TPA: tetratricopeptide repeat protein [Verrucomicrobiae bacterium]
MRRAKKKLFSPSLIRSAAIAIALLAGCSRSGPDLLRDGERLIQQGKFADAVIRLEAARNLLPETALVWNQLGLAYHGAGRPKDAVAAYSKALALDRNLSAARYNLGCLQLEQNNLPAAISELTTFTSLQPNSADGWLKLASAQFHARQLDAAERTLTHAIKLRPKDPAALNTAGLIQLSRRRAREAAGYFEDALKLQPGYAPALLNLAITHHQHLNNKPAALEKYRAYLALQPRPANWSNVNELVQQLDRELNPPPKPAPPAPGATLATTQRVARISAPAVSTSATPVSATNRAGATPPPAKPVVPLVSNIVARTGAPPSVPSQKVEVVQLQAEPPIKPAKPVNATPPPAKRPATNEPPAAKAPAATPVEDAATGNDPGSAPKSRPGFFQRLNPVRWFSGSDSSKKPETETKVARAPTRLDVPPVRESPESAPPLPAVVEPPPRYKYLRPSAPARGNRTEAQRFFARGLKEQTGGRLTQAITEYLAAVGADGSFFEAHYNLGLAAFDAGHLSRSLSAYEQALSINPTHVDARFNFALALQKANYIRDAVNELEKLLVEHPDETRAHLTLANLFAQQLGQSQPAREHYLKVLELQPRHPQASAIRYWLSTHP